MVTYLKEEQIEWLLETYSMDEILDAAELTEYDVLILLYNQGMLKDLPDRMVPL